MGWIYYRHCWLHIRTYTYATWKNNNCVLFVYMKNMHLRFQIELILFCYRITYFNQFNGWLMLKYCWNISSAFWHITGTMTYVWATSGADKTSRIISCALRVMPELGTFYLLFWSPTWHFGPKFLDSFYLHLKWLRGQVIWRNPKWLWLMTWYILGHPNLINCILYLLKLACVTFHGMFYNLCVRCLRLREHRQLQIMHGCCIQRYHNIWRVTSK